MLNIGNLIAMGFLSNEKQIYYAHWIGLCVRYLRQREI